MSGISELNRVLTHLGYAVRKDSLTKDQVDKIRKELTVSPKQQGRFVKQADSWPVFMESNSRYYLPRMWGLAEFGKAESDILVDGKALREDLKFVGKPYDYQTKIIDNFVDVGANGLICVPCGRGKTFMAISIAARIGRKFMVIVDKEFLLQQWSGELRALMPGIRIGVIQENKKQIGEVEQEPLTIPQLKEKLKEKGLKVGGTKEELLRRLHEANGGVREAPLEYDCCIAMIQTLVQRDFAETDFRPFGFAIFDECHHLGASNFSRALFKIQTKYMLGLSATPTRDDGLTKVFEWFLGTPVYWEKVREADPDVIVKKVDFESDDPTYNDEPRDFRGEMMLSTLLTNVLQCEERNQLIDTVLADLCKEKDRRILVLSERKSHLQRIENGLPNGTTVGYYIGGMKEEEREEGARTAQVLLGTYAMASEAMNIKTLNTMIMASPRKKIEQSTGRILRIQKDARTVQPIIVDIVDSHGVYQGQWLKRRTYYKRCSYKIQDSSCGANASANPQAEEPVAPLTLGKCLME